MIPVQNTVLSSTFDFWRNRTNEMANYFTTCAVTTDANSSTTPATGNAQITGTYISNSVFTGNSSVNVNIYTVSNTSANNTAYITVANSSVNTGLKLPTTSQYNNTFFLAANGTWTSVPVSNGEITYSGNNVKTVDGYNMTAYRGAEYLLTVKDNNANNYYTSKVLTTHDTVTAFITEYASFTTNTAVGTFTIGTSSNQVVLYFTPVSTNTTVRFVRTLI